MPHYNALGSGYQKIRNAPYAHKHNRYTEQQLADNPELKKGFYNVGNRMWFKKIQK